MFYDKENTPKIKFEELKPGMKIYSPDFQNPSGIEEMTLEKVIMYKIFKNDFDEEECEEVFDVSEMEHYSLDIGNGWQTSFYEKFSDKKECQKYMLSLLENGILEEEARINSWRENLDSWKNIRTNILSELKNDT